MKVSLITVAYRSSAVLPALLESIDVELETVVVEQSEDPAELAALDAVVEVGRGVDQLIAAPNRGYGAGLNRGVAESHGELLVLCNPDLVFEPGAIARMLELVARRGVGAVAPQQLWDRQGRWLLPQPQAHDFGDELARVLAPQRWAQRELELQLDLWSNDHPRALPVLSGACLVVERSTFEALGGFDERFFLYFEENDFCRRLWKRGLRTVLEPRARVVHAFGHAIGSAAAVHFAPSSALYRRLHLPFWWRWLRPQSPPPPPRGPASVDRPRALKGEALLISIHPSFVPAAMCRLEDGEEASAALLPAHAAGDFALARLGLDGRLVDLGTVEASGA